METLTFVVEEKAKGLRLDIFLVSALGKTHSRSFVKKLITGGNVTVNRKAAKAHHNVALGETVIVAIPEPAIPHLKPEDVPFEIVYEDKDVIVLNKPAGVNVHPVGNRLSGTLVNGLLFHCRDLSGIGGVLRPGIVHRLDKETSGLMVVAKNDSAHANLAGQFRNRTVKKRYVALVRGLVQLDNGRIDLSIARRKTDATKMGISFTDTKKKKAVTTYRVSRRFKDFTMLEVSIETGRTHQIRVHLAHMGHPVVGDRLYGSAKGLTRQALHALDLSFYHPSTKKLMEFTSPLPADMEGLIKRGAL